MFRGQHDSANTSERRPRACVVGSVALDIVARAATCGEPPRTGCAAAGNSGSNIAIRLSALGWDVHFVTLVGDDPAGRMVREDLLRWGVDASGVLQRPGYTTPLVFQIIDPGGDSTLLSGCPECGEGRVPLQVPAPSELPDGGLGAVEDCSVIVFDIPSPNALGYAEQVKANGGLVYYEASLTEADEVDIMAAGRIAEIAKCSADESSHYARLVDSESPVPLKLVTLGSRGVEYRYRNQDGPDLQGTVPATVVEDVVDTIGAGDAFTARLVDEFHAARPHWPNRREMLEGILAKAQADAARACAYAGARGDLRSPSGSEWIRTDVGFCCFRCQGATA